MENKLITIQKFDGTNFYMWKFKVELLLQRDKLWSTVNQEPPSPITDEWTLKDQAAKATICLAMEDKFLINVRTCTTAKHTWETLKGIYEHPSLSSKLHLMRKLYGTRYDHYSNMRDFVNAILELVGQLQNVGETTKDKNVIAILLCGLPNEYNGLITAIESKDDDSLTLEYVKIKLFEEALRREKEHNTNSTESLAMHTTRHVTNPPRPITCYGCGQLGHSKRECHQQSNRQDYNRWRNNPIEKRQSQASRDYTSMSAQQQVMYENEYVSLQDENSLDQEEEVPICQCSQETHKQYTALSGTTNEIDNGWILDSGATTHMTPNKNFFQEIIYLKTKIPVKLANGDIVFAEGKGNGLLKIDNDIQINDTVQIKNVLYVPSLKFQLLSIKQLCARGHDVKFKNNSCHIFNDGKLIASAQLNNGIFMLQENQGILAGPCIHRWHDRLGHKCQQTINKMDKDKTVNQLYVSKCNHSNFCRSCNLGKMKQKTFSLSQDTTPHPFHTIVTDLCGPMQVPSLGGNNYILTITDRFSRYIHISLLKFKSQATDEIQHYIELGHNKFGRYPAVLRSDGGGEFVNHRLDNYLKIKGVTHQVIVPYSPQQNGGAERVHSTLINMCRCMIKKYNLPLKLWGEAITTAAFIINRTIHSSTKRTPYELWNNKIPNLSQIKTFGCRAYAFKPRALRGKLDDTSTEGIYVGPGINTKGFRLWIPCSNTIITTTKMTFDEQPYDYSNLIKESSPEAYKFLCIPPTQEQEKSPEINSLPRRSLRENKGIPPVKLSY